MKALAKKSLRWDARSRLEKSIIEYRLLNVIATFVCLLPVPLHQLLQRFGSDKHRLGFHQYGPTYEALFRRLKYRRVKLLEIGIGGDVDDIGGRSLLAWQAYFPFGVIVGCDYQDRRALATWHTRIYCCNQGSSEDLTELQMREGPFDVIIDDGSHLNAHQILTFRTLFDSLKDGGLYIIEDVQTSFWPEAVGTVRWDGAHATDASFPATCMGHFLEMAKYLNHAEFLQPPDINSPFVQFMMRIKRIAFEHNLIAVFKGRNDDPSILGLLRKPR